MAAVNAVNYSFILLNLKLIFYILTYLYVEFWTFNKCWHE